MGWFPTTRDNSSNGWRFDIVGLLAVIGESSIEVYVQPIAGSWLGYIPRLIPAPQTLLRTERPKRLPSKKNVEVVGVFGGSTVSELNYFANAIHNIEEVEDFEFQEWRIRYTDKAQRERDEVINSPQGDPWHLPASHHCIRVRSVADLRIRLARKPLGARA